MTDWAADDWDKAEVDRSIICQACGVSTLPSEQPGQDAVCENPDCDSFGEVVQ
jgi:hypothetical protein